MLAQEREPPSLRMAEGVATTDAGGVNAQPDRSLEEPSGADLSNLEKFEGLIAVLVLILVVGLCWWLWRLRRWWKEQRERHVKVLDEIEMCEPASEPRPIPAQFRSRPRCPAFNLRNRSSTSALGCCRREFVDDLDDKDLDIMPMAGHRRSGYHQFLGWTLRDTHYAAAGPLHAHTPPRLRPRSQSLTTLAGQTGPVRVEQRRCLSTQ